MSKYVKLWEYLLRDGRQAFQLSFDEIQEILGFEIDHSFLNYKKEAIQYGYLVGKISLKERHINFSKIKD